MWQTPFSKFKIISCALTASQKYGRVDPRCGVIWGYFPLSFSVGIHDNGFKCLKLQLFMNETVCFHSQFWSLISFDQPLYKTTEPSICLTMFLLGFWKNGRGGEQIKWYPSPTFRSRVYVIHCSLKVFPKNSTSTKCHHNLQIYLTSETEGALLE